MINSDRPFLRAPRRRWIPREMVEAPSLDPAIPASKTRALLELHYGTATKVVVQYAERQAVHEAVGTGCFTDGIPPWLVDQSVHQQGDAAVVATLLGGRDEPCQVTEGTLARFDEAVTALASAQGTLANLRRRLRLVDKHDDAHPSPHRRPRRP